MAYFHYNSIADDIRVARNCNSRVLEVKSWRLRRAIDREMQEAAKKLNEGRGYYLGTISQMREEHPGHGPSVAQEDGHTYMWAYGASLRDRWGRQTISLIPIRQF